MTRVFRYKNNLVAIDGDEYLENLFVEIADDELDVIDEDDLDLSDVIDVSQYPIRHPANSDMYFNGREFVDNPHDVDIYIYKHKNGAFYCPATPADQEFLNEYEYEFPNFAIIGVDEHPVIDRYYPFYVGMSFVPDGMKVLYNDTCALTVLESPDYIHVIDRETPQWLKFQK